MYKIYPVSAGDEAFQNWVGPDKHELFITDISKEDTYLRSGKNVFEESMCAVLYVFIRMLGIYLMLLFISRLGQ